MNPSTSAHSIPIVLVTGINDATMKATTAVLQWDCPNTVVVRHEIDVHSSRLIRIVSDNSGILENVYLDLEHACIPCAIREDIIPTLTRLTHTNTWESIITHLPVSADAQQICRVAHWDSSLELNISSVVVAVDNATLTTDLRGSDTLQDRDIHCSHEDERGVAEVLCGLVEHADLIALAENAEATEDTTTWDFLRALPRPEVPIVRGLENLQAQQLVEAAHDHKASEAWIAHVRKARHDALVGGESWVLDFCSDKPFHPERLLNNIERLGTHDFRARGCFWVPSRPDAACMWDGAGGQLSIGTWGTWKNKRPFTRICVTGTGAGKEELRQAFEDSLLSDVEEVTLSARWGTESDGLEPWLGSMWEETY
ncbi:GTP-binding protein [Timonella sp. A28]|uniref:GTP-binding protein n=1 Tax=Timonella sp. A28 TaxID=3442640 RepID=UPI003EB955BF